MVQDTTQLKLDVPTDRLLEILAEKDNRTKIGELRHILKQYAKQEGVKIK